MCRAMGVPYRRLALGRHGNLQFWAPDEYFTNDRIEPIYRRLTEWPPATLESGGYASQASKNKLNLDTIALPTITRRLARALTREVFFAATGRRKERARLRDAVSALVQPRAAYKNIGALRKRS